MEEAFFAVGELKRRLMGEPEHEKGVSNEIRELSLAELRIELAAIACDLRLATE